MSGTDTKDLQLTRTHAAPGEPFVWLTAMGLSLGLLMVVGLLGIIVSNGLPVFWPSKIVEIQLKPGVKNPIPNGGQTITGEIVQTREKRIPILGADGTKIEDQNEVQIFVGNKDVNGSAFAFINNADIASMSEPSSGTPELTSGPARLSGVWPPSDTITRGLLPAALVSAAITFSTSSVVSGSK